MPKVLGNKEPEKLIPKLLKQAGEDKKIKYIIDPPFTPTQMKQLEEVIERGVREALEENGIPVRPEKIKLPEGKVEEAVSDVFLDKSNEKEV